jgi:FeS assembly SUF system protein
MVSKDAVMEALQQVYDPEIPINVVDLGLVYDVEIEDDNVHIKMSMTTPGCPLHGLMTSEAKMRVQSIEGVNEADVELVWDPPWSPERMSTVAREKLGWQQQ